MRRWPPRAGRRGQERRRATAANIVDALGLSAAQPNDTVAEFLAGDGINDGPKFRFPTDAAMGDGMILPATVGPCTPSRRPWTARRAAAPVHRHLPSASAYNERLGNAAYHADILAYSSARWDQEALESSALGHGLFTHALVEDSGARLTPPRAGGSTPCS